MIHAYTVDANHFIIEQSVLIHSFNFKQITTLSIFKRFILSIKHTLTVDKDEDVVFSGSVEFSNCITINKS